MLGLGDLFGHFVDVLVIQVSPSFLFFFLHVNKFACWSICPFYPVDLSTYPIISSCPSYSQAWRAEMKDCKCSADVQASVQGMNKDREQVSSRYSGFRSSNVQEVR